MPAGWVENTPREFFPGQSAPKSHAHSANICHLDASFRSELVVWGVGLAAVVLRMRRQMRIIRLVIFTALAVLPGQAAAQSFFQKLFGIGQSGGLAPPQKLGSRGVILQGPEVVPRMRGDNSQAVYPQSHRGDDAESRQWEHAPSGNFTTVCVRTCDGFYFPIRRSTSPRGFSHDAQVCRATCGAEARLFYRPDHADGPAAMSEPSGRNYMEMETALLYRQTLIAGCSCKPMPWSDSELERHDRYAAIETAAKEDMRRAVAEALAARQAAEAEEARRKNSQAGKIKSASAAPPREHAPAAPAPGVVAAAAKPGWSTQVIFDVAQDGDSDLSEASDEVPPAAPSETAVADPAAESGAPAVADPAPQKVEKRTRKDRARQQFAQRGSRQESAQSSGGWFGKPKYTWPGDTPYR